MGESARPATCLANRQACSVDTSTLAIVEPPHEPEETREPPATAGTDALRALIGAIGGPSALSDGLAGQTRALIDLVEANRAKLDGLAQGTPALSRRVEFRRPEPASDQLDEPPTDTADATRD